MPHLETGQGISNFPTCTAEGTNLLFYAVPDLITVDSSMRINFRINGKASVETDASEGISLPKICIFAFPSVSARSLHETQLRK